MHPRDDSSAAAQTIAFVVAGAIFMAAVGGLLLTAQRSDHDRHSRASDSQGSVAASSLADLILDSPGVGWSNGADGVTRLGLMASGGGLQRSSVDALRGAMVASTANSKVDYADAKAGLGLPAAQDFHIRMYPVGMQAIYNESLIGLHAGYIGDWSSLPAVSVSASTPQSQMPAQANVALNATLGPNTASERNILSQAGLSFTNRVYITAAAPDVSVDLVAPLVDQPITTYLNVPSLDGDVYPDIKAYLSANLPARLSQYDIIVVGSGVDHSAMTADAVKNGFRDWVLAGGTLVVLGSSSQNYQWIQPLFALGESTANGAPTAPDVNHPILKQPWDLDWTRYDNHGLTWDIKDSGQGAHFNDFIHVITQGTEDVLAVSKEGAFGSGRIILTTYMPREIATTLGQTEATHFFENIALFADHTDLYLDYGGEIPGDLLVSVAVRESWLWDSTLGQVPVEIEVHTWG